MATASSTAHGLAHILEALVRADGTAASPHAMRLTHPTAPMRDLADAVHAISVVHGAFPGLVDHARDVSGDDATSTWLAAAAAAMVEERALLARLTALVGPRPSTPGQRDSETAVLAQRHALEMLARSDRRGCAVGAALAFVLDWEAVRLILTNCADRTELAAPRAGAAASDARRLLAGMAPAAAVERATVFGAQQMLAQHRGLWHLMDARASARADM